MTVFSPWLRWMSSPCVPGQHGQDALFGSVFGINIDMTPQAFIGDRIADHIYWYLLVTDTLGVKSVTHVECVIVQCIKCKWCVNGVQMVCKRPNDMHIYTFYTPVGKTKKHGVGNKAEGEIEGRSGWKTLDAQKYIWPYVWNVSIQKRWHDEIFMNWFRSVLGFMK